MLGPAMGNGLEQDIVELFLRDILGVTRTRKLGYSVVEILEMGGKLPQLHVTWTVHHALHHSVLFQKRVA